VGEHLARVLARHYPDVGRLARATESELTTVPEIGPTVAKAIVSFFHEPQNERAIQALLSLGVRPVAPPSTGESPLKGKTVVFTGSLGSMTREQAQSLVEGLGGHASSSVSARTDWVVAGPGSGGKLEQAKKLGITVLSEEEFRAMLPQEPG
jgi:DNA ligase (NAD+)